LVKVKCSQAHCSRGWREGKETVTHKTVMHIPGDSPHTPPATAASAPDFFLGFDIPDDPAFRIIGGIYEKDGKTEPLKVRVPRFPDPLARPHTLRHNWGSPPPPPAAK
jgi:hypothetical protein